MDNSNVHGESTIAEDMLASGVNITELGKTVDRLIKDGVTLSMISGEINYRSVFPSSENLWLYDELKELHFQELQNIDECFTDRFEANQRPHGMTEIIGKDGVNHYLSYANGRLDDFIGNVELVAYNDDGTFTLREWGGSMYAEHNMSPQEIADKYLDNDMRVRFIIESDISARNNSKVLYKYYSTQRPVDIGTYPRDGMVDFLNYDSRQWVNDIGREAWGEIYYSRKLTDKELSDFEFKMPLEVAHEIEQRNNKERGSGMANAHYNVANIEQDGGEKTAKELLSEKLKNGVKSVIDSEKFKDYLKTSSRLVYNNYSFNNAFLVYLQKPDATHVMGYDAWKDFGRNVRQGATGAKIFIPVIASEKFKGGLVGQIKSSLKSELASNPSSSQVSYQLGQSKMEFTQNRSNGLIGLKVGGEERAVFKSDAELKKFVDNGILGKVPVYFNVGTVFDAKDVVIPEHLWVKRGFTQDEFLRDNKDNPIKNKRGETKIVNTAERQARFVDSIGLELAAQDPEKMSRLFSACSAICRNKGVAVLLHNEENDSILEGGAEGYFALPDTEPYNEALLAMGVEDKSIDECHNGIIVLNSGLEATKLCSVMLHEMAHSELHPNIEKLAAEMGEDKIPRSMREVQAQAVSYSVGALFGIEDNSFSFDYMASYTKGFEMQDLQKSLDVIHREVKSLFSDLKMELDKAGYSLDLNEKPKAVLESDTVKKVSQTSINYALEQEAACAAVLNELPTLAVQYANNPEILDILEETKNYAEIRQEDITCIKDNVAHLNDASTREAQDACVDAINNAKNRICGYANAHENLTERFLAVSESLRGSLKSDFNKDPLNTIKSLEVQYPNIADLSKSQLAYLSTSKFVSCEYGKLLRNDNTVCEFVDKICDRASLVGNYAAKNGTFVEVAFCEDFLDNPVFVNGTLCHPKIAENVIKQAEVQIQGIRKEFNERGEYFPYVKCDVTVYSPVSESGSGLHSINTKLCIGDGEQVSLKDHLLSCGGKGAVKAEIMSNFDSALKERSFKEKLFAPAPSNSALKQTVAVAQIEHSMSREGWKNEIALEKNALKVEKTQEQGKYFNRSKRGEKGKGE